MQVDSFALGEMLIDVYVQNNPGDEPILDETLAVFPSYYNNYVYDENGVAVDSSLARRIRSYESGQFSGTSRFKNVLC
ncbi:MAG: hypothetical protein B7C24_14470 [Bacteroidetes bacterium 4572_77]|nr:MAG: hypothetical protein B7C24_14470 [Bacteroidetes bacterium 4572_77]